jgi:hypothetical protein
MKTPATPICYGQTLFHGHVQEFYESASRHAGMRAKQLRAAGFRVATCSMGYQVTNVGSVKMTLLDAFGDIYNLPKVQLERI